MSVLPKRNHNLAPLAARHLPAILIQRPGEALQSLCKEIDPDNWNALRNVTLGFSCDPFPPVPDLDFDLVVQPV